MLPEQTSSHVKRSTFRMRINPETKQQAERVYRHYGLTLTDAINVFLQQSINENGLPFLLSPENAAYQKSKAMQRLMAEIDAGWQSAEDEGWLTLEEAEAQLGINHE